MIIIIKLKLCSVERFQSKFGQYYIQLKILILYTL